MLFETDLTGHRMEYIHHICMGMLEHSKDTLSIVVPKDFENKKKLYEWPSTDNVKFVYFQDDVKDSEEEGQIKHLYL